MPARRSANAAGESFQKLHERCLVRGRQAQWEEVWIQIRICTAALFVKIHDRFERGQAAVMHVGRGA